jgi:7-carboxy-7-deazaguanine synthase
MNENKTYKYPVMESFYTLQGEGFHQGRAAWFLRLGGCDVGCVWCDVKESWDATAFPQSTAVDILAPKEMPVITNHGIVVVTGGEPLMHDCTELTTALQQKGLQTHIETSGAYPVTGSWNWICVSPKKFKAPLPEVLQKADELKVVVFNKSDFEWAEKHAASVPANCKLYLQPEWGKKDEITPVITEYIQQHPEWELSVQLHKYINVP